MSLSAREAQGDTIPPLSEDQISRLCHLTEMRMSRYGLLEERTYLFNRKEIHESFRRLITAAVDMAARNVREDPDLRRWAGLAVDAYFNPDGHAKTASGRLAQAMWNLRHYLQKTAVPGKESGFKG